jgi:molybdate transport system substrate-binding protein
VQSGNAQIGIIALSLAINPELASKGGYYLISENLYEPLEQGFIITKRAANNPLAKRFAEFMSTPEARTIMKRYGFMLPGENSGK